MGENVIAYDFWTATMSNRVIGNPLLSPSRIKSQNDDAEKSQYGDEKSQYGDAGKKISKKNRQEKMK